MPTMNRTRLLHYIAVIGMLPAGLRAQGGRITELILRPGAGPGKATWVASGTAAGLERASVEQITAAFQWSRLPVQQDLPLPVDPSILFKVSSPDKLPPEQKAGSLALALLATSWRHAPAPGMQDFTVCGQLAADGLVTSTPETRQLLKEFAAKPVPGVTSLIVPSDCAAVIRKSIESGQMTFITDCVVWTVSDGRTAYQLLGMPPGKLQPAVKQYLAHKPEILRRKEKWQLFPEPAIRLSTAIDTTPSRHALNFPAFGPVCLNVLAWALPERVGLVESLLWDDDTANAVVQATGGGDERLWQFVQHGSKTFSNGVRQPAPSAPGRYAGIDYRQPGDYRLVLHFVSTNRHVYTLAPVQTCILDDQILLWQTLFEKSGVLLQRDKAGQPLSQNSIPVLDPGRFGKNPPSVMTTMMTHLLWWDSAGLITLAHGRTSDEKVRWLAGLTQRDKQRLWNRVCPPSNPNEFGEDVFKDSVGFGYYKFWETTPQLIAAFAKGPLGASLKMTEFARDKRVARHTVPLLSASADGRIEFILEGKAFSGKLIEQKPEGKNAPEPGQTAKSWRVVLERKPNLPARLINGGNELQITYGGVKDEDDGLAIWWVEAPSGKLPPKK